MLKVHDYIQQCTDSYSKLIRPASYDKRYGLCEMLLRHYFQVIHRVTPSHPVNRKIEKIRLVLFFFPFYYNYNFAFNGFVIIEID